MIFVVVVVLGQVMVRFQHTSEMVDEVTKVTEIEKILSWTSCKLLTLIDKIDAELTLFIPLFVHYRI